MGTLRFFVVLISALAATTASANWTWNVGYQNPAVSTFGLNLFYLGSEWGFEIGLGWIDVDARTDDEDDDEVEAVAGEEAEKDKDKDKDRAAVHLAGDADVKYMLSSGKFRPYLQGGFGLGIGASSDSGAGAGTGGGFAGLGILAGSPALYVYGSYNLNSARNGFVQAGVGFDL